MSIDGVDECGDARVLFVTCCCGRLQVQGGCNVSVVVTDAEYCDDDF